MSLIVLDRDGVINEDSEEFIKSADEFVPIDGSIDAIARLSHGGYQIAVATNQSGLARGLLDIDALIGIHDKLYRLVKEAGGAIDGVFFCAHGPDDGCECRKPKPGLLREIERRFATALTGVLVVGDSLGDIEAAHAVGARPVLVRTGKGARTLAEHRQQLGKVEVVDCLSALADRLLEGGEGEAA